MNTPFIKRVRRTLFITLGIYALLVGTHQGEFWPFSIFPMFSQAGQPWTRAVVRQVPDQTPDESFWQSVTLTDLLGEPLPLEDQGINQNDVANFISKTPVWDEQRLRGLRRLVERPRFSKSLLVYRVRGQLNQNAVETTAMPLILFTPDTTFTAPSLKGSPSIQQ